MRPKTLRIRVNWKLLALYLAAFLVTFWILGRLAAWGTCAWYGYQTGREVRYAAFIGCMVKTQEQWVPRNELRVIQ